MSSMPGASKQDTASATDMSLLAGPLVRLVLVGDVHYEWQPEDAEALAFLRPDAALFLGDFGEEAVELVNHIAAVPEPKAVILGNHDAWTALYRKPQTEAGYRLVDRQLQALGSSHIGYGAKRFTAASGQEFSVVGARPFSDGGARFRSHIFKHYYSITTMAQSAQRIMETVLEQPPDDPIILIGHNGPLGLGDRRFDICGRDFKPEEGDFGDPDLKEALDAIHSRGRSISLVAFGHMHSTLARVRGKGGLRNMVHVDTHTGTVFLNCAVVPRVRNSQAGERECHFVVVVLRGGTVESASNVWVKRGIHGALTISNEERLLYTEAAEDGGRCVRRIFMGHEESWSTVT